MKQCKRMAFTGEIRKEQYQCYQKSESDPSLTEDSSEYAKALKSRP